MRPRHGSFHGIQSNFGSFRHRRPADDGVQPHYDEMRRDERMAQQPLPDDKMRSPHQWSFYVPPQRLGSRRRCSVSATESTLLGGNSPLTGGGGGRNGTPHIVTPTIGTLPLWARRERFMKRNKMLSRGSTATPSQDRSVEDPPEPRRQPSDEVDEAESGGRPRFQLRLASTTDAGDINNVMGTVTSGIKTPSTTSTNRVQTPYSAIRNIHYEGGATPTQTIGPFSRTFPCSYYEKSPPLHFGVPSPNLLHPPTLLETGLLRGEAPPHQPDSVEKIPIRARSQSWLIRTRHLLDDEKLHRRTPIISKCMHILSVLLVIFTFPFCIPFCFRVAKEYERAVVFRLGRLIKRGTKGPGIFFIMPCIDTYKVVDLRVLSFDVPPQEILSRDSVTVSVEAVIYFRISNPVISVTNVNDAQFSTKLLAQTTLRNVLGTKTLSEILMERDNISSITEKVLDDGTDPWGVKVQRVEIKDIRLPHQLMRSMAAEAEAARDARARIIAADGERNASRSLVSAADTIRENKVSLHLRYLQTMSNIAQEHNHTIVLPLPMEIVGTLMRRFKLWQKVA